jgi:hypothetical protein
MVLMGYNRASLELMGGEDSSWEERLVIVEASNGKFIVIDPESLEL